MIAWLLWLLIVGALALGYRAGQLRERARLEEAADTALRRLQEPCR